MSMTAAEIVQSFITKVDPVTVELEDGRKVTIGKFKVRQIPLMANLMTLVQKDIAEKSEALGKEYQKLKDAEDAEGLKAFANDTEGNMNLIVSVVTNHLNSVAEVIASVTGLTLDAVLDLSIDELAALATGVVLLNKDFFIEKVLPAFVKILSQVPQLTK